MLITFRHSDIKIKRCKRCNNTYIDNPITASYHILGECESAHERYYRKIKLAWTEREKKKKKRKQKK
jgi:hypothetical protein